MKAGDEDDVQKSSQRKGEREKRMTDKGAEFVSEKKLKNREKYFNVLTALSQDLQRQLQYSEDGNAIKSLYSKWLDAYEAFLISHDELKAWLPPADQVYDEDRFKRRDQRFMQIKESVEHWFERNARSMQTDDRSVVSRLSSGSRSSYSAAKLEEGKRKAELLAKAAALQEKKQIEEAKLELKMREEELDIQTALKISDARTKVIEELEKGEQTENLSNHPIETNYQTPMLASVPDTTQALPFHTPSSTLQSSLNPHAPLFTTLSRSPMQQNWNKPVLTQAATTCVPNRMPYSTPCFPSTMQHSSPYVPVPSVANGIPDIGYSNNQKHDLEGIRIVAQELNKPKFEIQRFEGNPMDYARFMRQFNTRVCENTSSYEERLNFLLQFTSGEAYRIVTGYSHLNAESGYRATLKEFEERYGDPDVIAQAYVKKALNWSLIKQDNPRGLDDYAIFLTECRHAVNDATSGRALEYPENLRSIVKKLPFYLQEKWRNIVYELKEKREVIQFESLVKFVRKEAKKANDPIYGRDMMGSNIKQGQNERPTSSAKPRKNFATKTSEPEAPMANNTLQEQSQTKALAFAKPCAQCKGASHALEECRNIMKLLLKDRYAVLKSKGLCFSCLRSGHLKAACQNKLQCAHCNKSHPTLLHVDSWQGKRGSVMDGTSDQNNNGSSGISVAVSSTAHMGAGDTLRQALPVVPVRLKPRNSDKYVITYAFLDSGSTATFCTESVARLLNMEGKWTTLNLTVLGQHRKERCCVLPGLEVSDLDGKNTIELPPIYTQRSLPISKKDIVTSDDLRKWPHLCDIQIGYIDSDVGLLIGVNVPRAIEPWDVVSSINGGPFAVKTLLGWVINGPIDTISGSGDYSTYVTVNYIDARLEEQVRYQFNHDFCERVIDDVPEPSKDDRKFLELVKESVHFENGHYTVGLPFKSKNVIMPNNRRQAEQRLNSLARKLSCDSEFHDDYKAFMNKIIGEGYAQRVPIESLQQDDGRVWYLPHHGVIHPKKKKLRVVFDCAARFQGTSLNEQLLQGPNLTNTLIGTLIQFREEEVAVMGDIDSMFYQVRVPLHDATFLRFLWWKDGDPSGNVLEYQMVVHLFGATSSPSCVNFCLRKTAQDWAEHFSDDTIQTVLNNFYVDDCLKAVATVQNAIILVKDIQKLLNNGGFHISKWISNNREVMSSIPVSDRAKEIKDLDLDNDMLPMERALGVQWCVESDIFQFKLDFNKKPLTRRGMLSMVSSVFDPLGFLAPLLLKAKTVLQELCKLQLGWDDEIPDKLASIWNQWYNDLEKLRDFKVDRCFRPQGFWPISVQLHHFADASEVGYGTVSYLRFENARGEVVCSFVMGKSRVVPLKQTTIPRLELTAATVAVRTNKMLLRELNICVDSVTFWTDSMAVLRYILNSTSRFHTFVANRLAVIHEGSQPTDWRYINTRLNPADHASRGISAEGLLTLDGWIKAPSFLLEPEERWPIMPEQITFKESLIDDPEVKKTTIKTVGTKVKVTKENNPCGLNMLIDYYSSWYTLKRGVAWVLKVRKELLHRVTIKQLGSQKIPLDIPHNKAVLFYQDLKEAEREILQFIQEQEFSKEREALASANAHVSRDSTIRKLDPFLDKGLLRVGGRLHKSSLPIETKHPVILPKDHRVSTLILRQIHYDLLHGGRNHMLSRLRERFWIVHAPSLIRRIIAKCVTCRRHVSKVGEQKMAGLPRDRIVPDEPPFSRVGVDYFGPFEVKQRRSIIKRYGVIFTCLASRAVHLEVAVSLDTSSYINALRRFIARRGQVKKIRSDNGTNFVGAERELTRSIQEWNQSQIQSAMLQKNVDWQFNPPAGSHFGGVWERLIRSVRKVLNSVLKEQTLDDEGLATLMCEIEFILNDRPITRNTDHHCDLEPLTPNHLLLMKRKANLPPGVFDKKDVYHRRRWRQIQYMANLFWQRWIREYLPLLQERQKWFDIRRNLKIGDIVLVVDSNSPRNSWPMGLVCETFPDKEGLVRQVKVKTATNTLIRPVDKICTILEVD